MSGSPLFYEVRNQRLAKRVQEGLGASYAPKVLERTGRVLSATAVLVSNQPYPFSNSAAAPVGSSLLVQNIGRGAAAEYAPILGGGVIVVGGGSSASAPTYTDKPGKGIRYRAGPDIILNGVEAIDLLGSGSLTVARRGNRILVSNGNGTPLQEFEATAAGLAAASAVAVAGDQILLPTLTLAGDFTLTAGVHYAGVSRHGTVLTGQITGAAAASLECLSITRTANDANALYAVVGPSTGNLYITNCELSATQAGAGTGYAVSMAGGDVYIYNSRAFGSTAMTDEA